MALLTLAHMSLFVLLATQSVLALNPPQYCFYGCNSIAYQISFSGGSDPCSNELAYKTNYYCAAVYCSDAEIDAALSQFEHDCDYAVPSFSSVVGSVDLDSVPRISLKEAATTVKAPLDHVVIPDRYFYDVGFRTTVSGGSVPIFGIVLNILQAAFYNNFLFGFYFSYSLYGFWGLVVVIGTLNRLIEAWRSRRSFKPTKLSGLWLWTRRSLILPATFNQHCQEPLGWCTLPPRLESVLLVVYILLNFIYCFPGYNVFLPNTYYSETRLQLLRYISDRTGILSIANVPIFWLFATRNDPLLWLTGLSFATYNRFHRWVARVSTVQAIVHSIGYSTMTYYEGPGEYEASWKYQYWWTGGVATVVMSLSLIFAVYALRRDHYDFFLALHFLLALVFLITLYYHVKIWDGKFNGFIWPCVAIWSLDRLIRFARIAYCSLLPRLLKGVKATATYDSKSEMIRLDVTDIFTGKKIQPGLFYYLYTPAAIRGYESHPFTLCSWRQPAATSPMGSSQMSLADDKGDTKTPNTSRSVSLSGSDEIRHSFLIRPYEGFTGRLRTQLASSLESKSSCQVTVLLEGPYGNSLDLSRYSNILVITGGSGITAAISHTHNVLQSESVSVQIVWATPQKHLVDDIAAHELAAVLGHPRIDMEVYLTGAAVAEEDAITPTAPYTVRFGRPDVLAVMEQARSKSAENLAIVSCGTPPMSDACRRAVVEILKGDGPEVEYFDETMTW